MHEEAEDLRFQAEDWCRYAKADWESLREEDKAETIRSLGTVFSNHCDLLFQYGNEYAGVYRDQKRRARNWQIAVFVVGWVVAVINILAAAIAAPFLSPLAAVAAVSASLISGLQAYFNSGDKATAAARLHIDFHFVHSDCNFLWKAHVLPHGNSYAAYCNALIMIRKVLAQEKELLSRIPDAEKEKAAQAAASES